MPLHDYQIVARDFLRGRNRGALFLDMGLGKTAATLSALTPEHLPALVVAPKRVAELVWPHEKELWRPDLTLSLAKGEASRRRKALAANADLVVIGRDNFRDVEKVSPARPFNTLILDELSGFKSRQSIRWKTARRIINNKQTPVKHVWGLTGTPTPNGLMDLWSQIALLDNGSRLGKNITAYRSRYFYPGRQLPNGVISEWIPRPEAEDRIHSLLADLCLSMETEGRIELPPVTFNTVRIPLPPSVTSVYKELKRDLVTDLRDIFGGEIHTAGNAAILSSKLSQVTAGFLYVDDADIRGSKYTRLHTEKVKAVEEIIEGTGGSPVLVLYRFRAELELLKEGLGERAHTIDSPHVVDRWNRGEIPVLLAHPASVGHGLNLQHGGHTAVWTSLPWSLEEWEQANKRLARQGQKHPVVVHTISATGTLDDFIATRLKSKARVQDNLLDYLESPI
jgi:SNF2 family DNA or RNA helicase